MSILYLTPGVFDKGGISRYNRYQIKALRALYGDDAISVVSLAGHVPGDFEDSFHVTWSGSSPVTHKVRSLFVTAALRIALRKRPNIILSAHVNLGPLAWFLARSISGIMVQNIYGLEIWSGLKRIRKFALKRSDSIISDCHNTAQESIRLKLVSRAPCVIHDCVDIYRYTPGIALKETLDKYGVCKTGRFRILFLSRLTEDAIYKGIFRVMDITKALGDEFELVIGGSGSHMPVFRQAVLDKGIASRTLFTGGINESDMTDIYRSADVFYSVSEVGQEKGEGLPMTPLEAMACGVPVVVGNQDGSREILISGGGVCVDLRALSEQSQYIKRLSENRERHLTERVAARHRVEQAFSFERFMLETEIFFQDFLAKNLKGSATQIR